MTAHEYSYDFPIPLPADRATVFKALTEAEALEKWFAENAAVEAKEGGAYRFWGRFTLGKPGESEANQVITRFEPDKTLAFSWRVLGQDSEVTFSLRDDDGSEDSTATRLLVEHRLESLPDMGRAEALIDDLWRVHTGSLLQYLMGKDEIFRVDFSRPEAEVRCEIEIEATPENVFSVLITPEHISKWFPAPAPVVEPQVGGKYGFGFSYEKDGKTVEPPPCTILEYEANRRLAITWPDWRGDASVPDQKVTWLLEDLGGRTRLVLLHDGFVRPVDVSDYPFGWQHFMAEISKVSTSID